MSPGATYTKMSQNGVNPRPASLPLQHFIVKLCGTWLEPKIKSHQCGLGRIRKSRKKGLNQVEWSPNLMTTRRFRTQLNLRSNVGLEAMCQSDGGPSRARARPAGRPLTVTIEATQLPPTSGGDPERPHKGSGQLATSLGWPAPPGGL